MPEVLPKRMATRELQEIKCHARCRAAILIRSALESEQYTKILVQDGFSEKEAQLVVKEMAELATRLES